MTALLAHGCDVSLADESGATPLHRCAQANDEGMARELIDHGAPLDAPDKVGLM